jgi:predicted transcriptional regulator
MAKYHSVYVSEATHARIKEMAEADDRPIITYLDRLIMAEYERRQSATTLAGDADKK